MDILPFLRQRADNFRCPVCRRSLGDCRMRQLTHHGSQYTVEVTCRKCDMAFVVALELHSDSDDEDTETLAEELEPITSDEILEVHRALTGYQGALTNLLHKGDGDG
jgi:hypothetical protein